MSKNPSPELKRNDTPKALESKLFRGPIPVPETLRGAHPLIRQSAEILKSIDPDDLGLLKPPDNESLDITVSKKSLRRALLIMDGLLKALEGKGYEVFLAADSTLVRIDDVTLKISMREEIKTVQKERKKHDLEGYYHFGHSVFDTERVPSGNLWLTIDEHFWHWREHYRKNWRDTPTKKLEDQLHGFVNGLLKTADQKKAHLLEEEEKQRKRREMELERQERERIRAEKIEQKKLEKKKVSKLLSDTENWRKSQLLRKYIAEVQRRAENGDTNGIPDGDLTEWLDWANQQADRLDLGVFKRHKDRFPSFQDQVNMALRHHCMEGNLKWVSLLLWAGADPYAKGTLSPDEEPDPDGEDMNALEFAALYEHLDIFKLKQIKLEPESPDTRQLIREACHSGNADLLRDLIQKGFDPLDQEGDGSSLIQSIIQGMGYALDFDVFSDIRRKNIDSSRTREKIKMVHMLAEKGVRWTTKDRAEITEARRSFLRLKSDYIVEFIWIMSKYNACNRKDIEELIRTPAIKSLIADHMERVKELLERLTDDAALQKSQEGEISESHDS